MQEFSSSPRPGNIGASAVGKAAIRTPILNTGTSTAAYSAITAQRAADLAKKDKHERGVIGAVETAGMIGLFGSFMADLATAAVSKVLTIGGIGGADWKRKVDTTLRAPMRALRNTELKDFHQMRANSLRKGAEFAARSGDTTRASELLAKAEASSAKGHALGAKLSGVGKHLDKAGEFAERQAIRANKIAPVRWLDNGIKRFATWRMNVNDTKAAENAGKVADALKEGKQPNWFQRVVFRQKAVSAPMELYTAKGVTGAVEGLAGSAAKGHTLAEEAHAATSTIRNFAQTSAEGHSTLQGARSAVKQVANHAEVAGFWRGLSQSESAIGSALKGLPKGLGKASVFHVLAGVGIGLGIVARNMTTKRDNRLGDVALQEFAADVYGVDPTKVTKDMLVGKDAHPLVAEASKINDKTKRGRNAYGAISGVAEVANVGTLKTGGMLLIPWYMFGDKAASTALLSENDTLKAYAQLKAAEHGQAQLAPEQKVGLVRYLISAVPGFARNHGIDNRLIEPIAADIVSQGLDSKQIVQTIANPDKMVALAKTAQVKVEAKEAQAKAAAAEKAAATPTTSVKAANDNPKPLTSVSQADISHEGRVVAQQRAQAH